MLPQEHRSKVTIEDLLALKRAERPSEDFWKNFERELREKQLTALMVKRSWWQDLPHLLTRRAYLPIGATAILTFTLVSLKFYTPAGSVAALEVPTSLSHSEGGTSLADLNSAFANPVEVPTVALNDHDEAQDGSYYAHSTSDTSTRGDVDAYPVAQWATTETPSSRSIAANLARLEQSEPELINAVMGTRLSVPAVRADIDPRDAELATVYTGPSKRTRLLAQFSDRQREPEPTAPEFVRERLARRLADNDAVDRITRVGVRGDQVSLRF